ncbi:MAG TPA: hypothetical protein PLD20_24405 [Blastocatellia bacterium]|nr:hypothetical protein [Blastocatellia bacterium]HMV87932.1 hypothetical protein [Blastocatellia bacterium]HMY75190.1 hypothetical protein [Blastocatellia bacterium]HMZ21098.1 hypothetical protein [Blastocatellia bacterium]HNG34070.1 hypothetical protein [Blastocatellia bacterium]
MMADCRAINFQRRRRWGRAKLKLARLKNDAADSFTTVAEITDDFSVRELDDEGDGGRRQRFEFRLYNEATVARLDLESFDLVVFGARRMEVETKERKRELRSYIEIIARPTANLTTC